jgi:twitching motility protein PilJ
VAQTTAQVDNTSTELLAASTEQLREIREPAVGAGHGLAHQRGVGPGAGIGPVARQSLQAADSGLQAVQNAIGGMNAIRDQIQETSKRIKPGRILAGDRRNHRADFDITEQTNVLALNAAIQAARPVKPAAASRWWPKKCSAWPNARPTPRARSRRW